MKSALARASPRSARQTRRLPIPPLGVPSQQAWQSCPRPGASNEASRWRERDAASPPVPSWLGPAFPPSRATPPWPGLGGSLAHRPARPGAPQVPQPSTPSRPCTPQPHRLRSPPPQLLHRARKCSTTVSSRYRVHLRHLCGTGASTGSLVLRTHRPNCPAPTRGHCSHTHSRPRAVSGTFAPLGIPGVVRSNTGPQLASHAHAAGRPVQASHSQTGKPGNGLAHTSKVRKRRTFSWLPRGTETTRQTSSQGSTQCPWGRACTSQHCLQPKWPVPDIRRPRRWQQKRFNP